jgi:hypothetical protein
VLLKEEQYVTCRGYAGRNDGFWFELLDLLALGYTLFQLHSNYSALADLHIFQFTVAHPLGFSVTTSRLLATDLHTETSTHITTSIILKIFQLHFHHRCTVAHIKSSIRLEDCPVSADGLQDNSSERTPWKTVALLLRVCLPSHWIAMLTARTTQKTS